MILKSENSYVPWKTILGVWFLLIQCILFTYGQDIRKLPPTDGKMQGWKMIDSVRTISGDDLYGLIDGGAELYMEFGFNKVATSKYENDSKYTLQVEIYQMSSDSAAYGFYTTMLTSTAKPVKYGQGAMMFGYYLVFWKGPYFVTITGSDQSDNVKNAILETASIIDGNIKETGKIPSWLSVLPDDGLIDKKYVKGNIGLSNIYSFGSGNIFQVKEAVCGTYQNVRLFMFKYMDFNQAKSRLKSAVELISQNNLFTDIQKTDIGFKALDSKKNQVVAYPKENYILVFVYSDEKEYKKIEATIPYSSVINGYR